MLNDEEKKAIEFFEKSFKKKIPPYWYDDTISNIEEKIKTILNLIDKQSKEIEELFAENQSLKYTNGNMIHKDIVKVNYTPKDKIKPIQIIDLDGKIHNVYKIEEE